MKFENFRLTKNKTLEIQVEKEKEGTSLFNITIKWSICDDHAGFYLWLEVWKVWFNFEIVDNRHWDYDKKCWCVYNDKVGK